MRASSSRSVPAIDADLRTLRSVTRGASGELAEVRRRKRELADLEAELVMTVEQRSRRIDGVLDERLQAHRGSPWPPAPTGPACDAWQHR